MNTSTELFDAEDYSNDTWVGDNISNNCTQCLKVSSDEFCTCTEDPYDAVDVFQEVPFLRVTLATYFICIGFGGVGNLLTLFTMATADRKTKTGTNIFLISLSVSMNRLSYSCESTISNENGIR